MMRNIPAICQHITGDTAYTLPHFVNIIKCITALHCCCSYIYIVKLKVRVWGQMTRPGTEYEGLWQWLLTMTQVFREDNGLKCCVFVASNDSSPSFCCRGFNFALSIRQLVWTSLCTRHTLQKRNIHVIKY